MEVIAGSARFGLWYVHVRWAGTVIYQVRFSRVPLVGPVPVAIARYLAGRVVDLAMFEPGTPPPGEMYARIYGEVRCIPYGETATYGDVARLAGTSPRVVGQAMQRNMVPLVIPCHRVVSQSGIGGFTPDPAIKEDLIAMERRAKRRSREHAYL